MDLRDWLRPDRVVALLDLIEQCPSACRWREAASQDEEYVRQVKARQDSGRQAGMPVEKWAPRQSEYNLQSMLLANLVNLVGVIAEGKKIGRFEPVPAPRTVHDRIEAEEVLTSANSLIAQLTPHALINP